MVGFSQAVHVFVAHHFWMLGMYEGVGLRYGGWATSTYIELQTCIGQTFAEACRTCYFHFICIEQGLPAALGNQPHCIGLTIFSHLAAHQELGHPAP